MITEWVQLCWLKDKEQVYKELEPVELRELMGKKYKEKINRESKHQINVLSQIQRSEPKQKNS